MNMVLDQIINELINVEFFLFVVFPYLAILTCVVGSLWRYRYHQYTYSALSSQFFGSDKLVGWGLRLWHYGILLILFGHFLALVLTDTYLEVKHMITGGNLILEVAVNSIRIFAGLAALIGLLLLIFRRIINDYVHQVTSPMDIIILTLLLIQVIMGFVLIATHIGGDPNWFASDVAPWIQGIILLRPQVPADIDFLVGFHMLLPFFILALLPFSRLVHMFTFPVFYLIRPYQLVIWYRKKGKKLPASK